MHLSRTFVAAALVLAAQIGHAAQGLIEVPSAQSAKATMDKLEETVKQRGLTVFARIDHAAGATDTATVKNSGNIAVTVYARVRYYSGGPGNYTLGLSQ